jgi:CRISPR system Cascade subunit CasE
VRHDVVMNAKRELAISSKGRADYLSGELQYSTGIKWLESRAAKSGFNFAPEQIKVFGYQQHRIKKRQQWKAIRFSVLDFKGVLTVIDLDRFHQTLFSGIGPAKAFGCGLMLVRRL